MKSLLLCSNTFTSTYLPKKIFSLITIIFLAFAFTAANAQQNGSISGVVKTTDGAPVEMATVSIPALKLSTATNENGEFTISRVPAGTHTVEARFLSLAPQQTQVTVTAGRRNAVSLVLSQTSEQLQEVSITSDIANKFARKKSEQVARMPLENLENPQVYTSVSKELIAEQQIVDIKEILRNSPGVIPNNNPAGGSGGTIRGFNATTTVRNGMAVQSYQSDPINLERVEIIKGPAATLFGSSIVGFGGLVNQVTKKPFETFKGEVGVSLGSYQLSRFTADVNTPLNKEKTALLRINAASHKENTFQNFGHKNMTTFAPSFLYKVSDRLTFLLEAEFSKTDRSTVAYHQTLARSTYRNFNDIPIDFNVSLTGANLGAALTAVNYYGEAKYKMSDNWTSTTSFSFGENRIEHSHQVYLQWNATPVNSLNRSVFSYGPRNFSSINLQQNFNGDFKIGSLRNRMVAGVNFYSFRSFLRFSNAGTYDVLTPVRGVPIPGINLEKLDNLNAAATQTQSEGNQRSYSAYVSDVLNVTDRLAAMVSLRVDRFENDIPRNNPVPATSGNYNQTAFSPKLGLTYQVVKDQVTLFGNYMNGFQNVQPATQPNGSVSVFKPRQANQLEGGVKAELFNKMLSATLSYYDIKINNDTRTVDGFAVQDGNSRSKGLEAEIIANPLPGLNIIAGYATNEYKITKATFNANPVLFLEGKYQLQVPTKYGNLWASYKFPDGALKGFGLGFGGNYVSQNFFDAENLIVIPAYTVVNGSLFYDQPKWRFGLKGNNLSNQRYWTNYGIPETTRQVIGTLTFKF
ncbi:TonB-dependent siderophore receptor [Mucilaginibacter calamicampi]|uniref:TonB-dependent siderophore receptor n=1 Tax=Mucilaginibacter calamicampi TaxID=1302352 RepID=A0ABW2YQU6_9SPHI